MRTAVLGLLWRYHQTICAVSPDHLRSEILFLRTCRLQHSEFHILYIDLKDLLPLQTLHWLCVHMVAQMYAL